MDVALLATKLYIPPVRQHLVSRPRLVERLNDGLHRKLTLVSAPAGFGKTTLLSEWIHAAAEQDGRPLQIAWLSLDEGDDDPARFWSYFVAAMRTIPILDETGVGRTLLARLQAPAFGRAGALSMQALLTGLINEIASACAEPASTDSSLGIALVLDDYHTIGSQPIHDGVGFLVEHMPPQMHLVIATRSDPPLPIPRLRARDELTELRQADLSFSLEEATEFLQRVTGQNLRADDVASLASSTEGWIAGLQMATKAVERRDDFGGFVQALTGSDRHILDYLVEEVLQRQTGAVYAFLLQTCVLNRMTGSLCDSVTGSEGVGGATLEQLERANLFIVPLDNERRWYRYHRLFSDLLRKRLHETQSDLVPLLHQRASEWYEQNEDTASAIRHALAAGDSDRTAGLLEQIAEDMLMRGESATLRHWVKALPEETTRSRPLLSALDAGAMLLTGSSLDLVESRLQDASAADPGGVVSGHVAAFRAMLAAFQGDVGECLKLSKQALESLPRESLFLRSAVANNLGIVHMLSGDIPSAIEALDEVARMGREAGNVITTAMALGNVAGLYMLQGRLRKAAAIYRRVLGLTDDGRGRHLPIAGKALLGLGEIMREWNDLEAAERHIAEGIELTARYVEVGGVVGYVSLAHIRQARGDSGGAWETLQRAEELATKFDASQMDDVLVAAQQAWLWVRQGNTLAAARWAKERGLDREVSSIEPEGVGVSLGVALRASELLVLARVLMAQDRLADALTLLARLSPEMERRGRKRSMVQAQVLRALAFQAQGDTLPAVSALERALTLAEPEGYLRVFLDEDTALARLLRLAASRDVAPQYASSLLALLEGDTEQERGPKRAAPLSGPRPSLVEPLSERELEVLRLLTTHLSSTEIGEELGISANTVRFHIKNIYGKLGVHRRADAVGRAGSLGLL